MSNNNSSDLIDISKLVFVPSFHFILSLSKKAVEEYIMFHLNVNVLGYKKLEDEYWGKIYKGKNKTITFTLKLVKIKEKETRCIISIYNANTHESKKLSYSIYEKIRGIETNKLIYRKQVNES
jgi:hypothetical protein